MNIYVLHTFTSKVDIFRKLISDNGKGDIKSTCYFINNIYR